jgi:hypothetical protein
MHVLAGPAILTDGYPHAGLGETCPAGSPQWVLTDGWYGVKGELDGHLQLLAEQGKLKPGWQILPQDQVFVPAPCVFSFV